MHKTTNRWRTKNAIKYRNLGAFSRSGSLAVGENSVLSQELIIFVKLGDCILILQDFGRLAFMYDL